MQSLSQLLVLKWLHLGDLLVHGFKDLLERTCSGGQCAIRFLMWSSWEGGTYLGILLHLWVKEEPYKP